MGLADTDGSTRNSTQRCHILAETWDILLRSSLNMDTPNMMRA